MTTGVNRPVMGIPRGRVSIVDRTFSLSFLPYPMILLTSTKIVLRIKTFSVAPKGWFYLPRKSLDCTSAGPVILTVQFIRRLFFLGLLTVGLVRVGWIRVKKSNIGIVNLLITNENNHSRFSQLSPKSKATDFPCNIYSLYIPVKPAHMYDYSA